MPRPPRLSGIDWPMSGEGRLLAEVKGKVGGKMQRNFRRRGRRTTKFAKKSTWWAPLVGMATPFTSSDSLNPRPYAIDTFPTNDPKSIMGLTCAGMRGETTTGVEVVGEANKAVKIIRMQGSIFAWIGNELTGESILGGYNKASGLAMLNYMWMTIKLTGNTGSLSGGFPTSDFQAADINPLPQSNSAAAAGGDLVRLLARKDIQSWGTIQLNGPQPAFTDGEDTIQQRFPQGTVSGTVFVGHPGNNENHWDGGARLARIPGPRPGTVLRPGETLMLVVGAWHPSCGNIQYGPEATVFGTKTGTAYVYPMLRFLCTDA